MATTLLDAGIHHLEFTRGATLRLLDGIPPEKLCHQPVAGANHVVWIAGHITVTDRYMLVGACGGQSSVPAGWEKHFGMGSTPQAEPGSYPRYAEILEMLSVARSELVRHFRERSEAELSQSLPGDFARFAPNLGGLPFALAWHEGLHAGQITVVRRSLGMGPAFG